MAAAGSFVAAARCWAWLLDSGSPFIELSPRWRVYRVRWPDRRQQRAFPGGGLIRPESDLSRGVRCRSGPVVISGLDSGRVAGAVRFFSNKDAAGCQVLAWENKLALRAAGRKGAGRNRVDYRVEEFCARRHIVRNSGRSVGREGLPVGSRV